MTDNQLRIACAETLGWDNVEFPYGHGPKQIELEQHSGGKWRGILPNPLTSYDDAFALVEKAREEGWYVAIHTYLENAWLVIFSKYSKPKSEQWMAGPDIVIDATDPDLRRAICLAFLKLKGTL